MIEVTKLERKVYDGALISLSPPDVANLREVISRFLSSRPWFLPPEVELESWVRDLDNKLKENSR